MLHVRCCTFVLLLKGGGKLRRGEGKQEVKNPPQKSFGPPPHAYDTFPPSFCLRFVISLIKESGADQTNPIFF